MNFREARPGDSVAMSRVLIESIAHLCLPDHRGDSALVESWTANKSPEELMRWLRDSAKHMYVIEDDDDILCVGAFSDAGEVQLNYVAPRARFSGVSKMMLENLEEEMRERGIRTARLNSTETAHRFYLSAGWADDNSVEERPVLFGLRSYPMTKTLY